MSSKRIEIFEKSLNHFKKDSNFLKISLICLVATAAVPQFKLSPVDFQQPSEWLGLVWCSNTFFRILGQTYKFDEFATILNLSTFSLLKYTKHNFFGKIYDLVFRPFYNDFRSILQVSSGSPF
jgi:hypothetical protein